MSNTYTLLAREAYNSVMQSTINDPAKRGTMWANCKDLTDIIQTSKSDEETIKRIQNTYRYSINPPEKRITEKMVDWYLNYFDWYKSGSSLDVQESEYSVNTVYRDNVRLSPDFLRTLAIFLTIGNHTNIPTMVKPRIMEIGGGCGHLARTLKLILPNSTYIGIDLPETLFFAYVFLRLNFPDAKTLFVEHQDMLYKNLNDYDFVFVPTIFAEGLVGREVDLMVNTASMGEMNNKAIRYWMDFIQNKIKVRYFYGLNRFLNPFSVGGMLSHDRLNENEASVLFDARWNILHWEVEPSHSRCPYEEPSVVTRNLEIIAERMEIGKWLNFTETDCHNKSSEFAESLKDEDWFRHYGDANKNVAMRSNVLCNDLTMTGTLFKLWEAIRLYPNKENLGMMLKYLETLQKPNHPFEEWFYYKKLMGKGNSERHNFQLGLLEWYAMLILNAIPMWLRYKAWRMIKH